MQAKSAKLLDWIEEFEQGLEPDSLGYWLANRIAECLESDEEDTIGILACVEDLKVQAGRAPNRGVCTILQANVTQYRSEIKQWLVTNQYQIACLQETHVDKGQQNGLQSGLAAVSLESWRAQVLTLSPEGVLGQPLLPEGYVHDLVPGKTWLIKPFP